VSGALRIGSRRSPLARWQAHALARRLRTRFPRLRLAFVWITSSGDRDRTTPLYGMGGVGVFSKEVHEALLDGRADVGVHSLKDLPTAPPDGIAPARALPRGDPRDRLIGATSIEDLPEGALVGTSSLRRRAQLAHLRADLRFDVIRGNVATRLAKVADGDFDATLLAAAGLRRLGMQRLAGGISLEPEDACIPAPAQGAIGVDHRVDAPGIGRLLAAVECRETAAACAIERGLLALLRGGCSLPLGCYARRAGGRWHAAAFLADEDGKVHIARASGPATSLPRRLYEGLGKAEGGRL